MPRHLLTGSELGASEIDSLLDRAEDLRGRRGQGEGGTSLAGRTVALFFERPSTRTRISFQVGVAELGGHPLPLRADELQLGRGESIGDTARVLSRMVHAVVIRSSDETVEELAEAAGVPIVNALTPRHHPCQALADLQTLRQRFGRIDGLKLAYVGDGNNVARSLALLGATAGVEVRVAAPPGYELEPGLSVVATTDPREAVDGADAVYTDVWVSLNDEGDTTEAKRADLAPFQLNEELLAAAAPHAIVMHCLPAHPGEEITEGLLYGDRSAVWDQAENRLHAQKALLELLLSA